MESIGFMTKLRLSVRSFLKEANKLFVTYIYTIMGDRRYALEMAKLLDPKGEYFRDRVISRDDSTVSYKKSLDVVLGNQEAVVIVDDSKHAWEKKDQDNLIEIKRYHYFASSCREFKRNNKSLSRYHYFASSCREFKINNKSLSRLKIDESESNGALRKVLNILKRTHRLFFEDTSKNVRSMLKQVHYTSH